MTSEPMTDDRLAEIRESVARSRRFMKHIGRAGYIDRRHMIVHVEELLAEVERLKALLPEPDAPEPDSLQAYLNLCDAIDEAAGKVDDIEWNALHDRLDALWTKLTPGEQNIARKRTDD